MLHALPGDPPGAQEVLLGIPIKCQFAWIA